jgi:hypothetical protein
MEAIGHVLIYFLLVRPPLARSLDAYARVRRPQGRLPWQGIKAKTKQARAYHTRRTAHHWAPVC